MFFRRFLPDDLKDEMNVIDCCKGHINKYPFPMLYKVLHQNKIREILFIFCTSKNKTLDFQGL